MQAFYTLLRVIDSINKSLPSELQQLCHQIISQLQPMVSSDKTCFGLHIIASDILVRLECNNETQAQTWDEEDMAILNQRMEAIRFEIEEKSLDRSGLQTFRVRDHTINGHSTTVRLRTAQP